MTPTNSALLLLLLLLLKASLCCCSQQAVVTVRPDSVQIFHGHRVSLSCTVDGDNEDDGDSVWRLFRNTSKGTRQLCDAWAELKGSSCVSTAAVQMDSGLYWCESTETGASSMVINLTVTDLPVILQSPTLPVTEGSDVRLCCRTGTQCHREAVLYKDNTVMMSQQRDVTGHMTIQNMHKSNEGVYKCVINDTVESPSSWLKVKEKPNAPPHHFFTVLVPATVGALVLVVFPILLVFLLRRRKPEVREETALGKEAQPGDDVYYGPIFIRAKSGTEHSLEPVVYSSLQSNL